MLFDIFRYWLNVIPYRKTYNQALITDDYLCDIGSLG